jgi:hypothetical protein
MVAVYGDLSPCFRPFLRNSSLSGLQLSTQPRCATHRIVPLLLVLVILVRENFTQPRHFCLLSSQCATQLLAFLFGRSRGAPSRFHLQSLQLDALTVATLLLFARLHNRVKPRLHFLCLDFLRPHGLGLGAQMRLQLLAFSQRGIPSPGRCNALPQTAQQRLLLRLNLLPAERCKHRQ